MSSKFESKLMGSRIHANGAPFQAVRELLAVHQDLDLDGVIAIRTLRPKHDGRLLFVHLIQPGRTIIAGDCGACRLGAQEELLACCPQLAVRAELLSGGMGIDASASVNILRGGRSGN